MDDIGPTRLDIFKPRNIAKILLCAIFVGFVLYEMVHGFMYSDLVSGVNAIRQAEIAKDIAIVRFELIKDGEKGTLVIVGKNTSEKNYWTVVAFVDLLGENEEKLERIRVGVEGVPSNASFEIVEKIVRENVKSIRLIRLEGVTKDRRRDRDMP
jgi:hypothetical protein